MKNHSFSPIEEVRKAMNEMKSGKAVGQLITFLLSSLHNHNKDDPKRASAIRYGCRKFCIKAGVFSQTLAYGNSKNITRKKEKMNN